MRDGLARMTASLPADQQSRLCGIGIAAPFEMWKPHEIIDAEDSEFRSWQGADLAQEVARFTDLPVSLVNDATSACYAENTFGHGRDFREYAYFFIGAFAGGGVVINDVVFEGRRGNAGALGSVMSRDSQGKPVQLMDRASLFWLEASIREAGGDPQQLWTQGADWSMFEAQLGPWIEMASQELALAALSACAVIDFEAVLIDGAFPPNVRARLVRQTARKAREIETIGLVRPTIEEGTVGANARVLASAYRPLSSRFYPWTCGLRGAG